MNNELVIFETKDNDIKLDVPVDRDTVWLTQAQMTELFKVDRTVITRHVNNVFKEQELIKESNVQKMHIANSDKPVQFYSLEVIISVAFREKSDFDGDLINIGYMVFEPELFEYIDSDSTVFEKEPLTKLVEENQLAGYIHKGFWQCMDTLREKQKLEKMWEEGSAPWKIWED